MVLAIGSWSTTPSWWWRTSIADLWRGIAGTGIACKVRAKIVGPVISMTIHARCRVRADRFPRRLHRSLFRDSLPRSPVGDRSGVIALTLSPDDVLGLPQERRRRPLCQDRQQVFARLRAGRQAARIVRWIIAITGLFALDDLGPCRFSILQLEELRRRRYQGIVFSSSRGPKYANSTISISPRRKLDKVFASFPETDFALRLNGINGPQNGHRGMTAEAMGRAQALVDPAKPLVRRNSPRRGAQASHSQPAALAGGPAVCRCRW